MVDGLLKGFTSTFYTTVHQMKSFGWSFDELLHIPPLELSIFKNMIIREQKEKRDRAKSTRR